MSETPTIEDVFKERGKKPLQTLPSYEQWKSTPTPQNMRQIVKELEPTIQSAVNTYAGNKVGDPVRHRARILAAQAIRSYDPKYGASLQTHVNRQLQALQRMTPALTDPLPQPEKFRRDSQALTNATNSLQEVLGREPTDEELAEETKLPIARVIKVRSGQRARIPMSMYEADDDDESTPEPVASSRDDFDDWMDAVYHDLGETDKLIFMYRTGYRGQQPMPNQEIARKLGVSPAYISQRASWIQKRLDEFDG